MEFVEFYITCNPPLLPSGVDWVDELIELLYEPEIPWFKVLTPRECQKAVSDFIQDLLLKVVQEDTDLCDPDQAKRAGDAAHHVPSDIKTIGKRPRVFAWSQFQTDSGPEHGLFDAHRFPLNMHDLKHKAVWRGLESGDSWTIDYFLQLLASQWKDVGAPASIEEIQESFGCQITYNMAADLVYIGTDLDCLDTDKVTQALDNFLAVVTYGNRQCRQLLVPEETGTFRFAYKWLSHVGQDRATYISSKKGPPPDEFRRLQTAVTVRAQRQDANGTWTQDEYKYAPKQGVKPGTTKVFSLFEEFQYPKKLPTAVVNLFEKIVQASRTLRNGTSPNVPGNLGQNVRPIAPGGDTSVEDIFGESVPVLSAEPLEPAKQTSSRSLVETWRDGVRQAQQEKQVQSQEEEALISFDEPQEILPRESDLLAAAHLEMVMGVKDQQTSDARGHFDTSDDLICLEPAPQPHALDPSLKQTLQQPIDLLSQPPCVDWSQELSLSILDSVVPPLAGLTIQQVQAPTLVTTCPAPPEKAVFTPSNGRPSRKSHILKLAEAHTKDLASILELSPGLVSIELKFGRFYLKNLSHSQVDIGSGPYWTMAEMLDSLNADDVPESCIGFSTALTTCGPDVDDLVEMHPPGEAPWVHFETQVCYEISCCLEDQAPFIVEIDAETFKTCCRGVEKELGDLYLHCVRRPWDMQVRVSQRTALNQSTLHVAIADALVASMNVTPTSAKGFAIETTIDERLGATVESISIRHAARYRQTQETGSILTVAMTKRLVPGEKHEKRMKWRLGQKLYEGVPCLWYEVSVSSGRARDLFAENVGMAFGDRTSWDCEQLDREGVFEDICRPALGMITQMDEIGLLNDNGLRQKGHRSFHDSLAEAKERCGGESVFW
ncbi:hypothetical protein HRG_005859 [Hirsutella rhossiliensis]|uniref:Uncharacterized protein n=1 Tax=Hirsutella rhossiliensis TaxID=111463 RepID=A0A9P8SIM8_9HYPO|nr:uncharacterized protein HRG_05859 [Hirsutella rhossiliensis]KAH0963349.1 hypothetical protein HRG_05859 [Hirsutella rhossiliensis]